MNWMWVTSVFPLLNLLQKMPQPPNSNKFNTLLDRLMLGTSVVLIVGFACLVISLITSENALSRFIQMLMSSFLTHAKYYVYIYIPYLVLELLTNFSISWWFKNTEGFLLHCNPLIMYFFVISFICSIGIIPVRILFM